MRRFLWILAVLCLLLPMGVRAEEAKEPTAEEIGQQLFDKFDFSGMDNLLEEIFPDEKLSFMDTLTSVLSGDTELTFGLIIDFVTDQFAYELQSSRGSLIHILLLVIVAAVFSNFSSVFKSTQVAEISFFMLYMLLITICLNNFRILADAAATNLATLIQFMKLLGPIYFLAVGMATGSMSSVSFYQIVLLLVFLAEMIVLHFLIPVTQIYFMMKILGELSPEVPLTKFAEFLETVVSWTLKTLMAGIVGFNVIQGMIAPAIDSVKRSILLRGGESIPIIGNAIGGVTEVVIGTAVLIKNGIGVVGMIICLMICLTPIIQMAITSLLYQLLSALIQPISDKRFVNCVSSMADGTKLLLKVMVTTGILFMLTIAVVASSTGGS